MEKGAAAKRQRGRLRAAPGGVASPAEFGPEAAVRRRILIAAIGLAAIFVVARGIIVAGDLPAAVTATHMEALRADLPRLRAFLHRMPKGGDLHTHLSGAVYVERFIGWAAADGQCLRRADSTILPRPPGASAEQPCGTDPAVVPMAEAISGARGQATFDQLVNALSMRWFLPTLPVPSGHDQFFSVFGRINAATGGSDWAATLARIAEMTVDQLRLYDAASVQHAEFMVTLIEGDDRRRMAGVVAAAAGDTEVAKADPAVLKAALEQNGLPALVAARTQDMAGLVRRIEDLLDCDAQRTRPGCGVSFRYIAQVNRNSPPAEVFAQTAINAALVRAVPRIVAGINYVGPEDFRIAREDYRTHMGWVGFLAGRDVPVALHAGELWLGLVPPPDLDFHIREAVERAGARRIGHGTAIAFERDADGLIAEMRRQGVAVEIALTSSDVVLGVRGREHPISTYLAAGVPVVLATDDAGVSRIDLTNEYLRAARDHAIGYRTLRTLARNALEHSFLFGEDKARALDRHAAASAAFERSVADAQPWTAKLCAWARAALFLA